MRKIDLTNVTESGSFDRLPAGAYICKIVNVTDVADKEYLKITYDICEGEYKDHFSRIRGDHPDWAWVGAYVRSYKTTALPMFKRFCSCVSKSNSNFVFDGGAINADERTLTGKKIGIILREEEYYGNDGNKRTRLSVYREFPIDEIDKQKVPATKTIEEPAKPNNEFMVIPDNIDEEVPFS